MIQSDPRTRDSIWMAVSQALASLADPDVLEAVSPEPDEGFNPSESLAQDATNYLLATGAGASWLLVAAFMEDLTEVARHRAASRSVPPRTMGAQFATAQPRRTAGSQTLSSGRADPSRRVRTHSSDEEACWSGQEPVPPIVSEPALRQATDGPSPRPRGESFGALRRPSRR